MAHRVPRVDRTFASRIPGVGRLAAFVQRLASSPAGLLALLPLAIALDVIDVFDELAFGPLGMGVVFVLESAFLLGLTGRTSYALGFAAIDLVPGLDILPLATLTLLRTYMGAFGRAPEPARGPVIDV